MNDRKIKRYLLDYADHLRKNGRSESTIKGNLETVKAFHHEYEIETPRIRVPQLNDIFYILFHRCL